MLVVVLVLAPSLDALLAERFASLWRPTASHGFVTRVSGPEQYA